MTMPINRKAKISRTAQAAFFHIANGRPAHAERYIQQIERRTTANARNEALLLRQMQDYPKLLNVAHDLEWEKSEAAGWKTRALKAEAELALRRGEI